MCKLTICIVETKEQGIHIDYETDGLDGGTLKEIGTALFVAKQITALLAPAKQENSAIPDEEKLNVQGGNPAAN